MLLGGAAVNRSIGCGSTATAGDLTLPDEVLEEVVLVLAEQQDLGLLNDIAKVSN